jgi:VWFA-related protein
MCNKSPVQRAVAIAALAIFTLTSIASAQSRNKAVTTAGNEVTIVVTAHPHNDRAREAARKLQPDDFSVREDKRPQAVISIKRASEAPPIIEVLIQDDLVSRVSNEINDLKDFIRRLPEGSRVMTGYLTVGAMQVAQDFTTDRERAANSLRIVRGSAAAAPYSPYNGLVEGLKRFDSQPTGRRLVLFISDGLDVSRGFRSASPAMSVDLDRAIAEAQRRGVPVFTFYAPSVGLTSSSRLAVNFGQGSLNRLADDTGGEAFFSGTDFVTFNPYFKEFNELLALQWVVTYRTTNTGKGFRKIEVTTEQDVHLHYPEGYRPR